MNYEARGCEVWVKECGGWRRLATLVNWVQADEYANRLNGGEEQNG